MTLPRYAALAAAALSLAGCAHGPSGGAAAPRTSPPGLNAGATTPVEAPAPQTAAATPGAPVHDPAVRRGPAPLHEAPAARAPAPVHQVAAAPRIPTYDAPTARAPAPIHAPQPLIPVHQPAPPRIPTYDAPAFAPQAPAPSYAYAAPSYASAAPSYAYAAPESALPGGPRRPGEMAPVRDRADGQASGGSATASAGPRRAGRYRTAEGDLSAPAPEELRRVASLGPAAPARGFGFDPGMGPRLVEAARAQTRSPVRYDGAYVKIAYPWGDVPGDTGVCTDVLVRAYRQMGFDFQQMVHEDMRQAFSYYPSAEIYGLKEPDPNIDHRRVVNMEAFLERHAQNLTPTRNPQDYQPGDIVSWRISGTQPHMGIVSDKRDERTGVPYIIHNIGAGVKEENMLFLSPPVGHYRFAPSGGSGPIRTAGL
ncbi:DUF1287 domain-containing protein [Neomegalonema sp.]|uniref:DUF1287 domain-containing protein n=1 Tax=Neomegalonema sp. TaxID=2039713 RepID=UPI00262E2114|nr:DUF1287 domain-containing protein [Neomegalonema sp.]MDD2867918.1 DUF1287 domain-containing protein [Neomegalonema sp.]